nr:MAG TPA: hypothetical protein [Caudoviricetes sp.]
MISKYRKTDIILPLISNILSHIFIQKISTG